MFEIVENVPAGAVNILFEEKSKPRDRDLVLGKRIQWFQIAIGQNWHIWENDCIQFASWLFRPVRPHQCSAESVPSWAREFMPSLDALHLWDNCTTPCHVVVNFEKIVVNWIWFIDDPWLVSDGLSRTSPRVYLYLHHFLSTLFHFSWSAIKVPRQTEENINNWLIQDHVFGNVEPLLSQKKQKCSYSSNHFFQSICQPWTVYFENG